MKNIKKIIIYQDFETLIEISGHSRFLIFLLLFLRVYFILAIGYEKTRILPIPEDNEKFINSSFDFKFLKSAFFKLSGFQIRICHDVEDLSISGSKKVH